ncbi:RHH-type transcriptional regulator, proline utilization regulon repressor / proline dehydrogenase / delta 1-pyrroline-5-carboxylate dehydrogenase [Loktanella sp. DSM 29012]|uniref:bifunctional proline dehydrogenase/L-glutamate gamma-semialdehyde dehydrogenase PutA n=1 Tax=Loktanella sp. DSM 29012 TaxID=1881056 RepID=UPI0008C04420|nr:bifunctional proline dehydrogenase/L-glutamate gamma-semialdehyde dehydrogenase PutA [Loktanella sp. DSM 29012]SEQ46638.1 RHH-type transcriptional regulator, proline utilization regulon repressor / proline dehydrogenase / delta 1-pyrroline-5-carboxylate dehydrogenase [Loktanella sp. DSM 29012]
MPRDIHNTLREQIEAGIYADERAVVAELVGQSELTDADRARIVRNGADLVRQIRNSSEPGLMEVFLAEYGLSTDEGIALMCLAEALLRVPDSITIDALIEDKIAPSDWGKHLGHSASSLVNASTWALMLTGRVLDDEKPGITRHLRGAVKRLGEPVIRTAVGRAMREMGRQFVLGETIEKAMKRADGMQEKGFTYSYDMLGEAARTDKDARAYQLSYSRAISAIAKHCTHDSVAENPGISVKLSALHPRYEEAHRDRVMAELVPRVRSLAILAKAAGMGFNIDAEEADRLSLSLDVIEEVLSEPSLDGWDGFGVVVQAYGLRAGMVLDYLHAMAERLNRKIMVRLVKGAYWDAEIKRAQAMGIDGFPVFTAKSHTDVSYMVNARKLLGMTDRIYPQFATHNAHTVAAILDIADTMGRGTDDFEFQRLHGMGETLHTIVLKDRGTRCRIYAPVGAHEDLLAYLVRRLLENGANSSFVNQIVDEDVPPEVVAADPFENINKVPDLHAGPDLFQPERLNSKGFDLTHIPTLRQIAAARDTYRTAVWTVEPIIAGETDTTREVIERYNPAISGDLVGQIAHATPDDVAVALDAATTWDVPVQERARVLNDVADAFEDNYGVLFAALTREAGKALPDCVAELREAVDFLRYYAAQSLDQTEATPRGIWTCISPWNFPLAIFTGQIAAALAAGNAVLAKPAEQTPVVAKLAVELMHKAGVPANAVQLLPGGGDVGAAVTSDRRIKGVAFTGSTATARKIASAMAEHCLPGTPLIAETGGLNAMITDSTALPEHAVRDIINGAFRSAGQRCSALRCLYVQEDVADKLIDMLKGAMNALTLGDPWSLSNDIGPVIDAAAKAGIDDHIAKAAAEGRVIHQLPIPAQGHFVAPTIIALDSIADLEREVFGPVLHVVRFNARDLSKVVDAVNATGYGLTFGLHTRIDDRVEMIVNNVHCGNIYVNRDQIGAIVGSQPFGGEGLSGTGPKAGGPLYLPRFSTAAPGAALGGGWTTEDNAKRLEKALADAPKGASSEPRDMPGPTGESNRWSTHPRGPVLCMGPGQDMADAQAEAVRALGGQPVTARGEITPETLTLLSDLACVLWWGDEDRARAYAKALTQRDGPITALVTTMPDKAHVTHERHVCIDTTAAGGNAALLAEVAG